jgi:hypothetical protein
MAPVRSIRNPYRGINAHLHSRLQRDGAWGDFHGYYIGALLRSMQGALVSMGCFARLQASLQIRLVDERDALPQSDIAIFGAPPARTTASLPDAVIANDEAVLVLPALDALATREQAEKQYTAIGIYAVGTSGPEMGEPVAWIELLSPSNTGHHDDAKVYREKRDKLLSAGVVFAELDFLHETPPSIGGVVDYRAHKRRNSPADSHPYRVVVIDPRPSLEMGKAYIREFDVDEPLPPLVVPLRAADLLHVDLDGAYQQTYGEVMFGALYVDYAEFPARFERYSPADQARIARRMLAVLRAAHDGGDLETVAPLPVDAIPLDAALDLLAAEFDLRPEQS